jgi:hypothetical protein
MIRNKEIETSFKVICKHVLPEALKQYNLVLEVYSGHMRYRTRLGNFNEMITIKAYGIKAILTLVSITEVEVKEMNFGFLTPDYGQITYLTNAFRLVQLESMEHLRLSIRSEVATWGEPVFDIYGLAVPNVEFGFQKRDPFITSARKILANMLKATRRFSDLGKKIRSGKGVDI